MPQEFDPNEFAPKKKFKSTDESRLKGSGGYTRGFLESAVPDYNPLYTPETLPSFPVRAAKEIGHDIISGLASPFGAVTEGMAGLGLPFALRGAANLIKKFRGASEALPPIRNVEAPVAELPPVKPELLDDSGRMVAPPQSDLPVRPDGPWNQNLPPSLKPLNQTKMDIAQELGTGDPNDVATRLGAEGFYDELGVKDVANDPTGQTWLRDPRAKGPAIQPNEMAGIVRGVKNDPSINVEAFAGPDLPPSVPIKPELNKPLPSLPIEEGESIGAYLRRSGVDNIHTTPDEQVANRAAQVPDNGPVVPIKPDLPPKEPLTAEFAYEWPGFNEDGSPEKMYRVRGGDFGPEGGSDVTAQGLRDLGLEIPPDKPAMQKPLTLEDRQAVEATKPFDPSSLGFEGAADSQGTTILYRGSDGRGGNWFTDDLERAKYYASLEETGSGEGIIHSIEIPTKDLHLYDKSEVGARGKKFQVPDDILKNKKVVVNNEGTAKQFDEAEFVNPTTGEIIPESLAGQGDVPLNAPPTDVHFPPNVEKPLYHGTRKSFDEFSAKKGDESDFLGKWIHAAEDPDHAARVAIEPDIPIGKDGLVSAENLDPTTRPKPDFMTMPDSDVAGLNVRPVDINRVNPLDVTHSALNNKVIQDAEAILKQIPMNSWGRMLLREAIQDAKRYMKPETISKMGGENLTEVVPQIARNLKDEMLRAVQNHPEIVKGADFDALRYIDQPGWGNNYSVAVPSEFQVKSSFGKPANAAPDMPVRSATKRMGSPDLGLTGASPELPPSNVVDFGAAKNKQVNDQITGSMDNLTDEELRYLDSFDDFGHPLSGKAPPPPAGRDPILPVRQPIPETLNTNALSRPALHDKPWSPVGSMPDEQIPLMDVEPQIPFQPAGIPKPPTPYQPAGVMPQLGPAKPKAPMLGPQPPPPPIPPTPYQPAGIPKQLGPNPPNVPPMGPRKPPQPPNNPLVPQTPPPGGPIRSALSTHKAFLTSGDISAPGRQGKAFILNKAWWTSLDDMFKAWGSKKGSELVNDSIQNHPSGFFNRTTLQNGRQVKSWAEQMGLELPKHEEMFNNAISKKIAENAPPWIERSSRAHTAFLNKLRSDQFASMVKASQDAGIDPIKNQHIARAYAKFINDGTGRGSLGKLERNMELMNDVFFAPKNMSGQIRTWNNVLNLAKYYNYDPVLRRQALRSLFAVAGLGLGVGEIARLKGAQVSNDPTSADFRKIKIGDTRIDMFGGYQQFPVAAMKLLTGESTSTISGRTTDLTAGRYGQQTRASVAERFFINRLSPVASFIYAWMNNSEFDGKPFEAKRALFERTFPIAAKDIWELAQEDPALAAIMAPSTMTGLTGTQHYTGR